MLRFSNCQNGDPRDLLDTSSVHAMVVDNYETVSYAQRQRRFGTLHLPRTEIYVLISTSRVSALQDGQVLPMFPETLSGELARDAVRSGYALSFHRSSSWWDRAATCSLSVTAVPFEYQHGPRRILYDATDRTARDLVERIVSLSRGPRVDNAGLDAAVPDLAGGPENVAGVGVTSTELATSLSRGRDFAYVVPLPFDVPDRCRAAGEVLRSAPWLAGNGLSLVDVLLPLVSTFSVAIVANHPIGFADRSIGVECDQSGRVRFFGWTSGTEVP